MTTPPDLAAARAAAQALLAAQDSALAAHGERIAAAQEDVRPPLDALVKAIGVEAALRQQLGNAALTEELFGAAFPGIRNGGPPRPSVPVLLDWAAGVIAATDAMLVGEHRQRRRRLVVSRTASMTPEQAHEAERAAVRTFLARHARTVPPAVLAILAQAGLLDGREGAP